MYVEVQNAYYLLKARLLHNSNSVVHPSVRLREILFFRCYLRLIQNLLCEDSSDQKLLFIASL